jgi:predicted ATP-grasp superfamily ATP-dependent carboligase
MPDLRVLVTDACQRKALAVARTLGRRGWRVCLAGDDATDQAFYSRYCCERFLYPSPRSDFPGFVAALRDRVARGSYDVVLPMSDYATVALSRYRERFERHTHLAVPAYEALMATFDKPTVLARARALGIAVPRTFVPDSLDEVARVADQLDYPCVLKPRRGAGAEGVRYADSRADLIRKYAATDRRSDAVMHYWPPIVQEYVPGPVHDVNLLLDHGRFVAAQVERRLEMCPATGGPSVLVETTDEPELVGLALRLLQPLGWHGPAEAEFKIDQHDGRPHLMEVNTRFWGSIDIGIQAGIDMPYLACRLAMAEPIEAVTDYRVGLRYRWLVPYALLSLLHAGGAVPHTPRSLLPGRGTLCELDATDLFPHLTRLLRLARLCYKAPVWRRLFGYSR